jgi:hypothetical protein
VGQGWKPWLYLSFARPEVVVDIFPCVFHHFFVLVLPDHRKSPLSRRISPPPCVRTCSSMCHNTTPTKHKPGYIISPSSLLNVCNKAKWTLVNAIGRGDVSFHDKGGLADQSDVVTWVNSPVRFKVALNSIRSMCKMSNISLCLCSTTFFLSVLV